MPCSSAVIDHLIGGTGAMSALDILGAAHDGVVVIDASGTIVYVNEAYSTLMKVPAVKALGAKMEVITPNARTLAVLKTHLPIRAEAHFSEELGFDVVLTASPIFKNGEFIGVVTVFRGSQDLLELYAGYRRARGLADYYRECLEGSSHRIEGFDAVVGQNRGLRHVVQMASRVAITDAAILITGENGVGKDVLAHAIHGASARASKAFIAVNCAAIPDALLESELFGYEHGSFTGASKGGRLGKFELANGGTIFLDEVGDMSSSMQAKLLRVLQDGTIERVGASQTNAVDVRIIAATNRDLHKMVESGQFRQDLYYRLNVFPILLPPLRDRKDDIPFLAMHLLQQIASRYGRRAMSLAPESIEELQRHDWPGNIRELRNAIERAVILCSSDVLLPENFGLPTTEGEPEPVASAVGGLKADVRRTERRAYEEALSHARGNKSLAMLRLGVSRRTFYKRLKEFGMISRSEESLRH